MPSPRGFLSPGLQPLRDTTARAIVIGWLMNKDGRIYGMTEYRQHESWMRYLDIVGSSSWLVLPETWEIAAV